MKSAYELAMERLNQTAPSTKLTAAREIALRGEVAQAAAGGDFEKVEQLQQQLVLDRKKLQAELEDKKAAVRRGAR